MVLQYGQDLRLQPVSIICIDNLATKRSADVEPEVNLRIPLHAGDKACKGGIHSGFETQGRRQQKSKPGVSVATPKRLMSSKLKKNLFDIQ